MAKAFYKELAFKSELGNWQTPNWLFEILDKHFKFECDVCANDTNFLCEDYFTMEDSCLDQIWSYSNYMNPPYGRGIDKFLKKAYEEFTEWNHTTVGLIPARTDTLWFHKYIYPNKADYYFIQGRLRFNDQPNSAPFPNMIVVWSSDYKKEELNEIFKEVQKGRNEQNKRVRK